jgi:hypothetical protein
MKTNARDIVLSALLLFGALVRTDALAATGAPAEALGWLEQKATSDDGAASDQFGRAVVVDGDTAMIGSPNSTVDGHEGQGAVYVFTRSDGTWSQAQKLTASDGAAGDVFGIAVAISSDTAIVGAYSKDDYQGAAYVFRRTGANWSEAQKLTADDAAAFDQFGWSVALSGDTALIGATGASIGGNNGQGAAYAFTEAGGSWQQTGKFSSIDGAAADNFGWSVALDGSTALVGTGFVAIGENIYQGAAYVFDGSRGSWTQVQKLTASNGAAYDFFGLSVALSGDTALVGADGAATDGDPFSNQGVAYEFVESGGAWTELQQLAASDGQPSDGFGEWVSLAGDNALVGAPGVTVDGHASQGAAYLFTRDDGAGNWTQAHTFLASDGGENDQFGWEVALSGSTALIGAYGATVGTNGFQGAAYFYEIPLADAIFADGFDGPAMRAQAAP